MGAGGIAGPGFLAIPNHRTNWGFRSAGWASMPVGAGSIDWLKGNLSGLLSGHS
jgi:hypothetical protein